MAILTAPTIPQLFTYATSAGDSAGLIGRWTNDILTGYVAALPTQLNPITVKYNQAVGLLDGLGLDDQNLTDAQFVQAWEALVYAVCYDLLSRDVSGFTLPAEQSTKLEESYSQRMYDYFHRAGLAWKTLGMADASNPYIVYSPTTIELEAVTPRDLGRTYYPYNYYYVNG